MPDIIYDYISTGVDMIIAAVTISSIVILLYTVSALTISQSNQQANREQMTYYAEYNQFNDTDMYSSDVISSIVRFGNMIPIQVNLNDSGSNRLVVEPTGSITVIINNNVEKTIPKTTSEISKYVKSGEGSTGYYYHATLFTDGGGGNGLGGAITRITFQLIS